MRRIADAFAGYKPPAAGNPAGGSAIPRLYAKREAQGT